MAKEARYTYQLSALVTPEVGAVIDELDAAYPVGKAEIIRLALGVGIDKAAKLIRERYADRAPVESTPSVG